MINHDQSKLLISTKDLSHVINRLVLVEGWSKANAEAAAQQYRNYLFLKLKYGDQYDLPPSLDVDEVWHGHILHTEDYNRFSNAVFGKYLHHHPHHMNGTLSDADIAAQFETTQRLHLAEFGSYLLAIRPVSLRKRISGILQRLKLCLSGKYSTVSPNVNK